MIVSESTVVEVVDRTYASSDTDKTDTKDSVSPAARTETHCDGNAGLSNCGRYAE